MHSFSHQNPQAIDKKELLRKILGRQDNSSSQAAYSYKSQGPRELNKYRAIMRGSSNSWVERETAAAEPTKPTVILTFPFFDGTRLSYTARDFLGELIKEYDVIVLDKENPDLANSERLTHLRDLLNKKSSMLAMTAKKLKQNLSEISNDYIILDRDRYIRGVAAWREAVNVVVTDLPYELKPSTLDLSYTGCVPVLNPETIDKIQNALDPDEITEIILTTPNRYELKFIFKHFANLTRLIIANATSQWYYNETEALIDKYKNDVQLGKENPLEVILLKSPHSELDLDMNKSMDISRTWWGDSAEGLRQLFFEDDTTEQYQEQKEPIFKMDATYFGSNSLTEKNPDSIQSLQIINADLDSLDFVKKFKNLKRLTLNKVKISQFDLDIYDFPNLEDLVIIDCDELTLPKVLILNLISLSIVGNLNPALERLELYMPYLETLYIDGNAANLTISIASIGSTSLQHCIIRCPRLYLGASNINKTKSITIESDDLQLAIANGYNLSKLDVIAGRAYIDIQKSRLRAVHISAAMDYTTNLGTQLSRGLTTEFAKAHIEEMLKAPDDGKKYGFSKKIQTRAAFAKVLKYYLKDNENIPSFLIENNAETGFDIDNLLALSQYAEINDSPATIFTPTVRATPDAKTGDTAPHSADEKGFTLSLTEQQTYSRDNIRINILDEIEFKNNDISFVSNLNPKHFIPAVDVEVKELSADDIHIFKNKVKKHPELGSGALEGIFQPGEYHPLPTLTSQNPQDFKAVHYASKNKIIVEYNPEHSQFYARFADKNAKAENVQAIYLYERNPTYNKPLNSEPHSSTKPLDPQLLKILHKKLNDPKNKKLKPLQFLFDKTISNLEKIELLTNYCKFEILKLDTEPKASLDVLLETIIERKGVCRHRSYAFMLLARMIGVKTHIDPNEDHMFCEVFADDGWHRVDLGGAETKDLTPAEKRKNAFDVPAPEHKIDVSKTPTPITIKNIEPSVSKSTKESKASQVEEKQEELEAEEKQKPAAPSQVNLDNLIEEKYYQHIKKLVAIPELKSLDTLFEDKRELAPLIKVSSNNEVLALRQQLTSECNQRQVPYFYIENPDDIENDLAPYILRNSQRKQITGPLKKIISNRGVIIVNWSNFTPNQLATYKSLIDTIPTLSGHAVNREVKIIGIQNQSVSPCTSFSSRCQAFTVASELLVENLTESPKTSATPLDVDLFNQPCWEDILGKIKFSGHSITMENGDLIKAILEKRPLIIYNAPNEASLTALLQQIQVEKRIFFDGEWQTIPDDFKVTLAHKSHSQDAKNIHIEILKKDKLPSTGIIYLNLHNLYECYAKTTYDAKHEANDSNGYLQDYKENQVFYVTDNIPHEDWLKLTAAINKDYPNKTFKFILAPGASLGSTKNNNPVDLSTKSLIIVSNDPDYCAFNMQMYASDENPLVIDVTPETSFTDLIASVRQEPQSDPSKIDFIYEEKEMFQALKSGRRVILNGELSHSLYQQLLPLFSDNPQMDLNGKLFTKEEIKGRLFATMPKQAQEKLLLNNTKKIDFAVDDYKQAFPDDKALVDKIYQFYEAANRLSHRGMGRPSKPTISYHHLKRLIHTLKNPNNIHIHNPIKGLFLYDYPKNSMEYAYLNVLAKYLFQPNDTTPLNIAKYHRLIDRPKKTSYHDWEKLNCLRGADLAKLFENKNFNDILEPNSETPRLVPSLTEKISRLYSNKFKHDNTKRSHVKKREAELTTLINDDHTRGIFIKGDAGVAKTYTVKRLTKALGLICRTGENNIIKWLTDRSDKPILLLLDEANLSKDGTWDFLKGLYRGNNTIFYQDKEYPITPNHKVIVTGNPENYPGRHYHKIFREYFTTALFKMPEDRFLIEDILNPILGTATYSQQLIDAFHLIIKQNSSGVYSIRDLESLAWRTKTLLADTNDTSTLAEKIFKACVGEFAGNFKQTTMRQEFIVKLAKQLNIENTAKRPTMTTVGLLSIHSEHAHIIDAVRQDIQIRNQMLQTPTNAYQFYKQGALVEGESGLGKSTDLEACLIEAGFSKTASDTQKKYYVISAGDQNAHDILLKAFDEGSGVVLDELNLDPTLEALLNQLLTGEDKDGNFATKTGFIVLASQNSSADEGRVAVSRALRNRLHVLYMPTFSEAATKDIAAEAKVEHPDLYAKAFARVVKESKGLANTRTLYASLSEWLRVLKEAISGKEREGLFSKSESSNSPTPTPLSPRTSMQ